MAATNLLANTPGNGGYLRAATGAFITLNTHFYGLAWLNNVVPVQIGRRVGVGSGHGCIPAVGQLGAIAIRPTHIPAVDRTGTVIGNAHQTGKACAPLVAHHVGTFPTTDSNAARAAG